MIPTAMQFIPAVGLLTLIPWTPESPRWLMLNGRKAEAKKVLNIIRPKGNVQSGAVAAEADIIENSLAKSLASEEGSWLDLFRGNYLRRTWVRFSFIYFVIAESS